MKHFRPTLIILVSLIVGAAAPAAASEAHDHDHPHHDAPAKLSFDRGRQWTTDGPLRQAMMTMRTALAAKLRAIHQGSLAKEDFSALGKEIENQVGAIVAECKLEPKADAMLHIVIADLAAAADVLQGKADGRPAEAAHRAVNALNSYGVYFKHPGWAKLKQPH